MCVEAELLGRRGDALGLVRIERPRQAGAHVAEGAGARARVAHDHEGGVALAPALADVGAAGLLAHGGEAVPAHDADRLGMRRRPRGAHADPRRLGRPRARAAPASAAAGDASGVAGALKSQSSGLGSPPL